MGVDVYGLVFGVCMVVCSCGGSVLKVVCWFSCSVWM